MPSKKSAIIVNDFTNIEEIVTLLKYLDSNDTAYNEYLEFKHRGITNKYLKTVLHERQWGTGSDWQKPNFVEAFECMVCRRLHKNRKLKRKGRKPLQYQSSVEHYGCPRPKRFSDSPPGDLRRIDDDWWSTEWLESKFSPGSTPVHQH